MNKLGDYVLVAIICATFGALCTMALLEIPDVVLTFTG